MDSIFIFNYNNYDFIYMKSLVDFLNEGIKGSDHPRFKCSTTDKIIPENKVLEYAVSDNKELQELFDRMFRGEFGNDYIICLAWWALGKTLVVNTETQLRFENTPEGGVIVNVDDDRDAYDLFTLKKSSDFDGIVLFNKKDFMSWK